MNQDQDQAHAKAATTLQKASSKGKFKGVARAKAGGEYREETSGSRHTAACLADSPQLPPHQTHNRWPNVLGSRRPY